MFFTELTATVACLVVAVITLVGCANNRPCPSETELSGNDDVSTELSGNDAERPQTFVTCRATLTAFEMDHPWFEDNSFGHDDGGAPLASLVIAEPSSYADRTIGILFKYSADAAGASPPDNSDIGRQFSVQLPEDFLKGNAKTINNQSVRHFQRIEP